MGYINESVIYNIYPLGFCGAPKENDFKQEYRLDKIYGWIDHMKSMSVNALVFNPVFESSKHGYDTIDYKKIDCRLGDNESFKKICKTLHDNGIRIMLDGVFNHVGRDFFAFKDVQQNRENSRYASWFENVNFRNNSPYNDGFSYEGWAGYYDLVKLNLHNDEVVNYLLDCARFWIDEFDIDGLRLDAADCIDIEFFKKLKNVCKEKKSDFWLYGEITHGDYNHWANPDVLDSVTNYECYKGIYSSHNDHNYFEIAHTVKYLQNMGDLDLYNFVDNHDVERIHTKLQNKAHFAPVHVLLYTLPGVPSIYYGSEFGIDGKKEKFSDASLRPALDLNDYADAATKNPCTALIAALGKVRQGTPALSYGSYAELALTNRQFAFARDLEGIRVIVTVNNDDSDSEMNLPTGSAPEYVGALTGQKVSAQGGRIRVRVAANSGEIWLPAGDMPEYKPVQTNVPETAAAKENENAASGAEEEQAAENNTVTEAAPEKEVSNAENTDKASDNTANPADVPSTPEAESSNPQETETVTAPNPHKTPEEMTVGELQAAILAKMAGNGPVDDQMKKTVYDNIWHDSLVNWLKSFR